MNAPTLIRPLSLYRPWALRLFDRVVLAAVALQGSLLRAWRHWRAEREERIAAEHALELDEASLRDMGAPLWLQEAARARREQRDFRREIDRVHAEVGPGRYY